MTNSRIFAFVIIGYIFLFSAGLDASPRRINTNAHGFEALINNDPHLALEIFSDNTKSNNLQTRGTAFRGLAFTYDFLGQSDSSVRSFFRAYQADKNDILLSAAASSLTHFSRTHAGAAISEGYSALEELSKRKNFFSATFTADLATRYLNDGNVRKAARLMRPLGVVRTFRMIGPFENISGSGYANSFAPEQELDFEAKYLGKDGTETSWFPFHNNAVDGWVRTENNYSATDAVIYYYANIVSAKTQDVNIGFGASGAFKVFLNDNLVLADPVFRNTGMDMFMQTVTLNKGDNKLLIKMCHEHSHSNFLVRFFDSKSRGLSSISYNNNMGVFQKAASNFSDLVNSPFSQLIENYLLDRINNNGEDLEAALTLIKFYNSAELTAKGQQFSRSLIARYPQSSIIHSLYSESLFRGGRITDARTAMRSAFRLCKDNYYAWWNELQVLFASAALPEIRAFMDASPPHCRSSFQALLFMLSHYSQMGNRTEFTKAIDKIEKNYSNVKAAVSLLSDHYSSHGDIRQSEILLRNYLRHEQTASEIYFELASLYLRSGQRKKAMQTFAQSLRFSPNNPAAYYYLSRLAFQERNYSQALKHVKDGLALMPSSSTLSSLKGSILTAQGEIGEAKDAFRKAIAYAYNNFEAWSQLRFLEGKRELQSLVSAPNPADLAARSKGWSDLNSVNGAILSYSKDVFFYPSRSVRERHFLMVHLPTRSAIETWKEYYIRYNSNFQVLNITRAYSKSANGKETPADLSQNMIVFKTLLPGDNIILEWTTENYYRHDMARQVWGEHEFSLGFPVFETRLRLVTPISDTIPYTVTGNNIKVEKENICDFTITTFSKKPYSRTLIEPFAALTELNTDERVHYSTFNCWSEITQWYLNLTKNKHEQTYDIKMLADSLIAGAADSLDKVRRIHEYITSTIRYSFIPFRQSGWIPQSSMEVLSTRIGDCKDMSSLGKSLLNAAGIQSNLVLVNTGEHGNTPPSYIGPNFNHCILSYTIGGELEYIDFTDKYNALGNLPRLVQGTPALVIKRGENSLITLPQDSAHNRMLLRSVVSSVDELGTLRRTVKSMRTGVHAGDYRVNVWAMSPAEQKKDLQRLLSTVFPRVVIDSMSAQGGEGVGDYVNAQYSFTAVNGAQQSGNNTILLDLDINDRIAPEHFPFKSGRTQDIDMTQLWFGIGTFELDGILNFPADWELINKPEDVKLEGSWGHYSISFKQTENKLEYARRAVFSFHSPVPAAQSGELYSLFSKIIAADNVQLVFFRK
ncbi:MAG: tetratricopeptide repeat protein [Chitinispirillia bacterium]|nr:tetratricopeptide repeat protein [Chitinispirillia bacterium]